MGMARLGKLYDRLVNLGRAFDAACDHVTRTGQLPAMAEKASRPGSARGSAAGKLGGSPSSWRPWSGDPYQQLTEYRNWVYTAVRFRAIRRQSPPLVVRYVAPGEREKHYHDRRKAYRHGDTVGMRRFVSKSAQPAGARVGTDLEYLPADSPPMKLLHNPNEPQVGIDLWFMASVYEDTTGRAHIWKVRNGRGDVVELWALPTPWVDPRSGNDRLIDYYRVTMPGGYTEDLDADDVITIGEPSPWGYLAWQSPLQAHGLNVDLFNAIVTARFNGLVNGANVGTMIKVPSTMADSPEKMDRFERSLLSRVVGGINYNRPIIMEEGGELINLTPQMEVAFMESAKTGRADIFAAFDLDESVMGYANESTYAGAVVTDRNIHKKIVHPYQERRNAILTEKLLIPDFGADLVAINEWKAEETPDERDARIRLMKDCGATSVNEVREELGKEPYDDPIYDEPIPAGGTLSAGQLPDDDPKAPGSRAAENRLEKLLSFSTNGVH